jgi:hypothetical protein
MTSRFQPAQAIADAVLYEGYLLYPYRATSRKNQVRWQFGVLAPTSWCDAGGCENAWMQTECLVEPGPSPRLEGRLRFLQLQRRSVEDLAGVRQGSLEAEGSLWTSWDEGVERTVDFTIGEHTFVSFMIPGGRDIEPIVSPSGACVGRFVRERWAIAGEIHLTLTPVAAIGPLVRLRVRVDNVTIDVDLRASRDDAMRASMIGAHVFLGVDDGAFVSLLEPPEWASAAARASTNVRLWPVIVGAAAGNDVVLASPIILYDHPQIAPESPGDLHDATEIDEILTLRTLTLTDEEKREARATDPRAAAIIDRVEAMPPETLERLHGTMRGNPFVVGSRVVLKPGARRTDAQDMFLVGRSATVQAVRVDLEGQRYVAVTLDDDPAADLKLEQSRFLYFYPDELELALVPSP